MDEEKDFEREEKRSRPRACEKGGAAFAAVKQQKKSVLSDPI